MISENYLPLWTLIMKEVRRFIKVGMQTVLGPAISALLFLAVFSLALGRSIESINGVNFANYIAPGLIMMTILQNSFSNAASSIGQAKFQGNIVDILMSPISDFELAVGYITGAIIRGLLCGIVTFFGIILFINVNIYSYTILFFYALMGSVMMSALSVMVGIWADKWDQQQGITNFIVLPLTFLSGTFYSINRLPEFWKNISAFNPFFYNIDGFRYAFIGKSDSSLLIGGTSLLILNTFLVYCCYLMFRSGYKLKS